MTLLELVVWLVIATICGAIGRALAGGTSGGFIVSMVLGFIGSFIGSWVARQMHLPEPFVVSVSGHRFPIMWSIVGAALFVAILHLASGSRFRRRAF